MNIDLELYRIFYTVAKCKNISKASRKHSSKKHYKEKTGGRYKFTQINEYL